MANNNRRILWLSAFIASTLLAVASAAIENTEISRAIDASSNIVRVVTNIQATGR